MLFPLIILTTYVTSYSLHSFLFISINPYTFKTVCWLFEDNYLIKFRQDTLFSTPNFFAAVFLSSWHAVPKADDGRNRVQSLLAGGLTATVAT